MHKDQGKPWGLKDPAERNKFFDLVRDEIGRDEFDTMYQLYRASNLWRRLYAEKEKQVGRLCQWCHRRKAQVLHHLTYDNLFNEIEHLDNLVYICHPCHKAHHAKHPICAYYAWQRGNKNLFLLGHVVVGAEVTDLTDEKPDRPQTVVTEIEAVYNPALESEWQKIRPQLLI